MPPLQISNGNQRLRRVSPFIQERVAQFEAPRPQQSDQESDNEEEEPEQEELEEEEGSEQLDPEGTDLPTAHVPTFESSDPPSSPPTPAPINYGVPTHVPYAVRDINGQIRYLADGISIEVIDLDRRFRRVPVTPTMLASYSWMRGSADLKYDPLHHGLFPVPKRHWNAGRIIIPFLRGEQSWDELWRGMTFFWDEAIARPLLPQPPAPVVIRGPEIKNEHGKLLTCFEYMAKFFAMKGKNHHKGEKVYSDFGYVRDASTGAIIDPDTTRGMLPDDSFLHVNDNKEGEEGLLRKLDFRRSEKHGPRIMSEDELKTFYEDYVPFCEDHVDAEGDPRNSRITPKTFLIWASGAQRVDPNEEAPVDTGNMIWTQEPKPAEPEKKPKRLWDFQLDTGEEAWEYRSEEEPALWVEPAGVDMANVPNFFQRQLPSVFRQLQRKAFGTDQTDRVAELTPPSATSELGVITDDKIIRSLAKGEFEKIKDTLEQRLQEVRDVLSKFDVLDAKVDETQTELKDLAKEVFFMKVRQVEDQLRAFRSFYTRVAVETQVGNELGGGRLDFEGEDIPEILDLGARAAIAANAYLRDYFPRMFPVDDSTSHQHQDSNNEHPTTDDDAGAHGSSCVDHSDDTRSSANGHNVNDPATPSQPKEVVAAESVSPRSIGRLSFKISKAVRMNEDSFISRAKASGFSLGDNHKAVPPRPRSDGFDYEDYYPDDLDFASPPKPEDGASWDFEPDLGDPFTDYNSPPPLAPFPPTKEEKPSKYRRFLEDKLEHEQLKIGTTLVWIEEYETEHKKMIKELEELRAERKDLLKFFGVQQSAQIPGFRIPNPRPQELYDFEKQILEQERREDEMGQREEVLVQTTI